MLVFDSEGEQEEKAGLQKVASMTTALALKSSGTGSIEMVVFGRRVGPNQAVISADLKPAEVFVVPCHTRL